MSNLVSSNTIIGTPYHYRTSGGVENRVKTLQDELNILMNAKKGKGKNWYEHLPRALSIVNNKENRDTGLSPTSILFGYRPTSPLDLLSGPVIDEDEESALENFLQRRDTDRQRHADRRRQDRERR